MNIVEMCLEEISASVRCFRAAFMPATLPAGAPVVANISGVMLNMVFVILDAIEDTKRRALWPVASKIFDQNLLKINIRRPTRRWATASLQ